MPNGEVREPRPWLPGGGLRPVIQPELQDLWTELLGFRPEFRAGVLAGWVAQGRIPMQQAESLALAMKELPEPEPAVERVPRRFEPEPMPPMPPAGAEYYPFLERMGVPSMRRYYETRLPAIFGEFEAKAPEAREEWLTERWRRKQEPERLKALSRAKTIEVARAKRALPQVAAPGVAPFYERYRKLQEETKGIETRLKRAARLAKEELPDPFATYLAGYPFAERFMELPPAERGFYPSRYRPPTRWLTY